MASEITLTETATRARWVGWRTVTTVAGPALLVLVGFVSPINDSDEPTDRLNDLLANAGRYNVTITCLAAAMMLLVPAVFAVRDLAPLRARRTATIAATIAATGFMTFLVASGALGFGPAAWTNLPVSRGQSEELRAAFVAMDGGEGALGPVLLGPLLPIIGLGLMATVLWRHTTAPRLALVAMPLGWAIFLFSPVNPVRSIGAALLLVAFCWMRDGSVGVLPPVGARISQPSARA